jgi:hypothetical protein
LTTAIDVWKRCLRDPVTFANVLLPKKPHPGQVEWLNNSTEMINVLVPGNRWGKSTVEAMKHIWKCVSQHDKPKGSSGYETISIAHSADQAEIVFKEARALLSHPVTKPLVAAYRTTPFPSIRFFNGSIMHCRSAHDGGKYIDGHAYRYLSIDEAGWIDDLRTLMNGVILLRLAGGGQVDLIGTPKGYNDLYFYFERGRRKVKGYYAQRGSIYDNPHLAKEDLEERDRLLATGDKKLREQALFGEFVDFAGLAFTRDQLDQAIDLDMPQETPWKEGHRYVVAADLGRIQDFTVITVLDITERPWRLVKYVRLNKVAWEVIYETIRNVINDYHVREAYIDASGPGGDVVEEELIKREIPVFGIKMSSKAGKTDLINTLQNALDEGRQVVGSYESVDEDGRVTVHPSLEEPGGSWGALRLPPIVQLMDELNLYRFDDKKLVQDSVISLALATKAAYDREAVREPVAGGFYGRGGWGDI